MFNIAGFIALCLIWGSTWLGIKIGLEGVPPFTGAAYRFMIAAIFIYLLALLTGKGKLSFGKSWPMVIWVGLFTYPIPYGLVYWGSQYVESGLAAVLFAVMPFYVVILAHFYLKNDRLSIVKVSGMVAGFCGILLIFAENLGTKGNLGIWGMIAILVSSFFSGLATMLAKKHLHEINPIQMTAVQAGMGAIILMGIGLLFEDRLKFQVNTTSISAILYLGIIGTAIAFSIYFHLLRRMEASKLATLAFITPIVALFLGIIYRHESFEPMTVIGSLIVLLGVLIVVMGDKIKLYFNRNQAANG